MKMYYKVTNLKLDKQTPISIVHFLEKEKTDFPKVFEIKTLSFVVSKRYLKMRFFPAKTIKTANLRRNMEVIL